MSRLRGAAVNLCRVVTALTFIVSGYVKAIDPLGTQYKLHDYLAAMHIAAHIPDWLTLAAAVALAATEFTLGIMVLFAIRRRIVTKLMVLVMAVMTALTVWIYLADPVSDCGCFGDAITLTNGQTLLKNILLLACTMVMMRWPLSMGRLISKSNQWIVFNFTAIYILVTSALCLYLLPFIDFRPYHIGADIWKGMEIPDDAEQPEFKTTFLLKKNGTVKEFTLDDYPDSTWQFVETKTVQTKAGYEPPIHDFSLTDNATGDDITDKVLQDKGYTFLLVAPQLEKADDSNFGDIDQLYEYAHEHGIPFYCLTASSQNAMERWRDITGAEYPFVTADETTLKTIIRSNPGLVLIKDGKVINKWSHNRLPKASEMKASPDKLDIGRMPKESTPARLLRIFLWFLLPLALLTIADRLWAWTRWIDKNRIQTEYTNSLKRKRK